MKNISPVRIALLPLYDIVEVKQLNNGKIVVTGGYLYDFFEMTIRSLNVPIEILIPKEQVWGHQQDDGNWSGLVGMITRDEADIGFAGLYMTEERLQVVDFAYPFDLLQPRFATRKPGVMYSSSLTFLYPFSMHVWIAIISALLCLSVIMKYVLSRRCTFQDYCFQLLGSIFKQPTLISSSVLIDRILLLSILFGTFVISVSYSSVLLSFMTVPLREEGIKDVKTLARAVRSKKMQIYALENSTPNRLSNHSDEDIQYLMKKVIEEKLILKPDDDILLKYIFEKKNALMASQLTLRTLLGTVDYLISDDVFSTNLVSVIMKKNFKLKEKINKYIIRSAAFYIYEKSKDRFFFRKEKYFAHSSSDSEMRITLEKLNGVFIALLVGYILSISALFAEIAYFRLARNG